MASDKEYMVTTVDNPYNYFTEFAQWLQWDRDSGYYTLELLARVTKTSDDLPQPLQDAAIDDAIDEIVNEILPGLYIKVASPSEN